MNRAFSPFLKSLLTALIAISSIAATAAYAADAPAAPAKPDPAKGEALYSNGDATRNLTACVSCHGAAGNSTITQNPRLAGQHDAYIMKQLTDFKSGDRSNPIMSPLAKFIAAASPTRTFRLAQPATARTVRAFRRNIRAWPASIRTTLVPS